VKIAYIILALFVFILSVKPCCADDTCNDSDRTVTTEHAHDQQPENDCGTDCCLFNNCGSSGGFIFSTASFSIIPSTIQLAKQGSVYYSSFLSVFHPSIWQPPKVS